MRLLTAVLLSVASPSLLATALTVSLVTGTFLGVPHNYTGNGQGFRMGAFDVHNPHTAGLVLLDVTLTGIGSGDDSTAFSEIGLFIDFNNNGTYEPGVDVRYAAAYVAYPADNGSLTFTEAIELAPGETKRFLVVGKMSGTVLPKFMDGFRTIVTSISATGGTPTGIPTNFNEGIVVINHHTPLRLEYNVTGSGPPYTYAFRLVLDNHDGSWVPGQEWGSVYFGQAVFGSGGTVPFAGWTTNSASYPVGPYVSTGWSSFQVAGINYDCPVLVDNISPTDYWMPSAVGDYLTWSGTVGTFLDEGQMSWSMHRFGGPTVAGSANIEPAYRVGDYIRVVAVPAAVVRPGPLETGSGAGFLVGAFDVIAHSNAATLSSLTLAALGTGDDSAAYSDIRLYVDANGNGAFDPGVDTPFGASFTAFGADDGSLTFNDTLNLAINETKRLLVVCKLNGSTPASYGQTFAARITAISGTGQNHSGLPTAAVAGIRIHAPAIGVTSTGMKLSAFANGVGPGGLGLSVADFVLANNAVGAAALGSITVAAAGSLFDQSAFSFVALYEDSNANGTFDAADTLYGTAAAAFPGDDGSLAFSGVMNFAPGQSRRLFLVVKLNGGAAVGDDFWARVTALGVGGGVEVAATGALVHGLTIVPGSDPAGLQPGGGKNGDKGSGGCVAAAPGAAAAVLAALAVWAITRRRRQNFRLPQGR
ncbi:MAG: hypothetical protein HS108_03725 [Planctomycetes bacterium]|nr:hypothetical protein [Planctomycetota bacterium]